jgi:hydrogenase-1 operon protein HyaF
MHRIETVSITTEASAPSGADSSSPCSVPTGNVTPLLHEIRHALARWLHDGTAHAIDLHGIPMGPGEEEQLLATLGEGEVSARLDALGTSEIVETTFPGVWLVTHYNDEQVAVGRYIEICHIPDILKSQAEDATTALRHLDELLSNVETTL